MASVISSGQFSAGASSLSVPSISSATPIFQIVDHVNGPIVRAEKETIVIGSEKSVVKIPGRLECGSMAGTLCALCQKKPGVGILVQGEKNAVLFCPECVKSVPGPLSDLAKQFEVMEKVEKSNA